MKKLYSIYLEPDLHKSIRILAAERGCNISDVVAEAIKKYLNEE
jgi:predicted DNA-binding protein